MEFSQFNIPFPAQMRPHQHQRMSMYGGKTCVCGKYTSKELEHGQRDGLHTATICLDHSLTNDTEIDIKDINDLLNVVHLT